MKKIIALLLTVITVMMLLTSCGGSGSPDPEPTSKSRPVTTGKEENMLTRVVPFRISSKASARYFSLA